MSGLAQLLIQLILALHLASGHNQPSDFPACTSIFGKGKVVTGAGVSCSMEVQPLITATQAIAGNMEILCKKVHIHFMGAVAPETPCAKLLLCYVTTTCFIVAVP